MGDTDTATPVESSRLASRKFLLTLLITILLTVTFGLGRMGVELWAGCLLAIHLTYIGGNVGSTLASGIVAALTALLQPKGRP